MNISKELQKKINVLLNNNEDLKEKILEGDSTAISQVGLISQKGIRAEDIVDAYEKNDTETMKNLYEKAKRILELQELYKELCLAYYKGNINIDKDEER